MCSVSYDRWLCKVIIIIIIIIIIMETSLNKLVEYAAPGPQNLIVMSGGGSKLHTRFNPPLEYNTSSVGYEMSLLRLETYFSFPNIDSTNNTIRISIGRKKYDVQIPTGCYDIDSINNVVQRLLMELTGEKEKEKHIILSANKNTLRCILEIRDTTTSVDFNIDNSLRSVLGFNAKQYKGAGRYESENIVNILSVNSILVHCDIIDASRVNGVAAPVIYNFFPDVSPGEKIVSQPLHFIYISLTMDVIPSMSSWLTDQNGSELDLRGEELTLTFHVRKKKH